MKGREVYPARAGSPFIRTDSEKWNEVWKEFYVSNQHRSLTNGRDPALAGSPFIRTDSEKWNEVWKEFYVSNQHRSQTNGRYPAVAGSTLSALFMESGVKRKVSSPIILKRNYTKPISVTGLKLFSRLKRDNGAKSLEGNVSMLSIK